MSGRHPNEDGISIEIRSMLIEMDAIVERLRLSEKEAYVEACRRNPAYSKSDGLKLRFLRVENYNTGLAVHRLCQYFDFKIHWFGQQLLARPILLSDLSSDDLAVLRRGDIDVSEQRDTGRRRIAHYICRCRRGKSERSDDTHHDAVACRRALFFLLDSIGIEDEDAQVHGITSIVSADWDDGTTGLIPLHNFSSTRNVQHSNTRRQIVEPEILFEIGRYLAFAAPLKVVHLHFVYCLQSEGLDEIAKWLSFMSNRIHGRVSFHSHPIESYVDGQNSLLSHGIPAEAIHMLDERFWGYERDRRLFDGKRGSMLTSITKGLPIGKSLVVEKNNSEDSSSSSSTGLDSKFTSNNSLLQKDTSRNQYSESRGVEVLHSPGGGVILNSRSFLPSDTIDRFENSRLIAPRATLRGDDDCTKKRKRAGPVTLPSVLYFDDDADHLSPYQCLLRQQIEIFEACSDDVQYNASRMNRVIVLSQVGLRCRHCAGSPEWERANGAVYYPGRLDMLYQASQNMAKNHLCTICQKIPCETRDLLSILRTDKRRATAGKEYWAQAAQRMGIFEDESQDSKTSRLRFRLSTGPKK